MNELKNLIRGVITQLYASAILRCILLAVSVYILIFTLLKITGFSGNTTLVSSVFALFGLAIGVYLTRIYQDKKALAVSLIHQTLGDTEYSLNLLEKENLNIAEQLQIDRILQKLHGNDGSRFHFPLKNIYSGIGFYVIFLAVSAGLYFILPNLSFSQSAQAKSASKFVGENAKRELTAPVFKDSRVLIVPPDYTGLTKQNSNDLNISAVVGSIVSWDVTFDHSNNLSVRLANSRGEELKFENANETFKYSDKITNSGLYSIRAYWGDSLVYQSDFYKLEAVPDKAPVIEPLSKELYQYHYHNDNKNIRVQATITDDFIVDQAFIVATVARGSGENVKFREVRFPLTPAHFKQAKLEKVIDLKALNFTPGDELYYYWAAIDNKKPEANFTKSDTYFLVYKDTTETQAMELATMAVDIMPEYFRSQRQIIIDTKKLIAKKKKISPTDFKSASNDLGFDQKVLRLRYGQYLGEEFESDIGGAALPDDGDILASFEHKSDASEEDGFRQQKKRKEDDGHHHEEAHGSGEEKDPLVAILEQFGHSHDDEETATFYEESTKNMLKMALEQMWQSELHLRMYEPEKAIPFETKALEYLKNAQQKVRAYVKKSGFDPPPIKEKEKRLTGELADAFTNPDKGKMYDRKKTAQLVAEILGFLEYDKLSAVQRAKIQATGSQLSEVILNGKVGNIKDWSVLTSLQKLVTGKFLTVEEKQKLRISLFSLSERSLQKGDTYSSDNKLEKEFWKGVR